MNNPIKKILIIRLSALGDTIHTIPMVYALKKEYPNANIDWVVEDKASEFIINNPIINKVYEIPRNKWKKNINKIKNIKEYIEIIKLIRNENYDIVIDTQQLLKSSIIMGLSKGKRKITLDGGREFSGFFANEIINTGRKQFDINYHVVKRNMEIAKYLGCKDLKEEFIIPNFSEKISEEIKNTIETADKTKKIIVIAPATTWTNKHWIITGWVEVINEFKDKYNIILTGSEKEKGLIQQILAKTNDSRIIDLSGKTTLKDLTYIFNKSDLVITPDSGSCHIAWATGHPKIISLFFATSANRTAPYGEKYIAVSSRSSCSPCMKKHCRLKTNKNLCRENIQSEKIINIVKKVLQ